MTTPAIFIFFPLILSLILYFFEKKPSMNRTVGVIVSILLMLFAYFQKFGAVWKIGPVSIEINTTMNVMGRSFILANQDKYFLVLVYFFAALWFGAARAAGVPARFIPFGLAIISVLTAALAVEPFIYSAILVEIAVLITIPLLLKPGIPAGKGVLRFLVFQSLAMPLVLFGGWLLGGIQASPSDAARQLQAVVFLAIGFSFWLAVFPFHSWVPQLSADIHPYISGFLLGLFPLVTLLIMLDFISGLVWLRESIYLQPSLRLVGSIMIVTTGIWAAIEKDTRRLLGYAVLLESGFALIAVSMQSEMGVLSLFISFIPRIGALAVMSLALAILTNKGFPSNLDHLSGVARRYPIAAFAFVIALLSIIGCPLLGGFPIRLELLKQMQTIDIGGTIWVFVGMMALCIAFFRVLQTITQPVVEHWSIGETPIQTIFLVFGVAALLLFGLLPHLFTGLLQPLFENLPILR